VLLLTMLLGTIWRHSVLQQQLVAQLVDQHVGALASGNPADVFATDSTAIKSLFSEKMPFSVDIPQLEGTQFTLVKGRVTSFQREPAAQLIFGARKHRISVFVFPDHGRMAALGEETSPIQSVGFATETWVEDGVRYFAISDLEGSESVRQLCELLKQPG
jgi:anti-sigma factor RsiW